jgi:hypothetical protein
MQMQMQQQIPQQRLQYQPIQLLNLQNSASGIIPAAGKFSSRISSLIGVTTFLFLIKYTFSKISKE